MFKQSLYAIALMGAVQAQAALVVDTGTPVPVANGYPLAVDGNDWLAGQVNFNQALVINSIKAYLNDQGNIGSGYAGDTFTIALYSDAANAPGALIASATGHFTTASGDSGWNGASNLHWAVGPGTYWAAVEIGAADTFVGEAPVTAPNPLARYAFNSGGYAGYQVFSGYAAGLQIDATPAVPEPASFAMILAGLGVLGLLVNRRPH